jgi:asparagine synthase (glutamine-hydrolysing)
MEWSAALPGHYKLRGGVTKYLFKRAMEPWLPESLIHRTKMGFGIPRNEWIAGPLAPMVDDLLRSPDSRIYTYMEPQAVGDLIDRHARTGSLGAQIWAILMLELWHREVLES